MLGDYAVIQWRLKKQMKIAILLVCHKNVDQINRLISVLSHENIDFFIHVDKKSNIINDITKNKKVFLVPDKQRVDVKWGTFSQVEASLQLLRMAANHDEYDYFWQISGQVFPLRKASDIVDFFKTNDVNYINLFTSKNNGLQRSNNYDKRNDIYFSDWMFKKGLLYRIVRRSWIEITGGYDKTFSFAQRRNTTNCKFFFGSSWWCINGSFVNYVLDYINNHKEYCAYFKNTSCPDESFFQTLLMNSQYRNKRQDYLHYVDWSRGGNNPKILTIDDFNKLMTSDKLMARKFDDSVDSRIIATIMKKMYQG